MEHLEACNVGRSLWFCIGCLMEVPDRDSTGNEIPMTVVAPLPARRSEFNDSPARMAWKSAPQTSRSLCLLERVLLSRIFLSFFTNHRHADPNYSGQQLESLKGTQRPHKHKDPTNGFQKPWSLHNPYMPHTMYHHILYTIFYKLYTID